MLAKEDFMVIQALTKRGVYQRDIAETLGVHPKTVQRALKRSGASPPRPPWRPSLLDGYRAEVDRLLGEGVWNGVVIFRELQVQGYRGRLSILRDYIRPKRALRPGRATVRFETAPGQQLQSDWGEIETVRDTLSRRGGQRHPRPAIRDTSPPDSATGPSYRRWRRR